MIYRPTKLKILKTRFDDCVVYSLYISAFFAVDVCSCFIGQFPPMPLNQAMNKQWMQCSSWRNWCSIENKMAADLKKNKVADNRMMEDCQTAPDEVRFGSRVVELWKRAISNTVADVLRHEHRIQLFFYILLSKFSIFYMAFFQCNFSNSVWQTYCPLPK